MRCTSARKLISRSQDSAVSEKDAALLASHLSECRSCRALRDAEARALELLDLWSLPEPRLGYDALMARREGRIRKSQQGWRLPSLPRWATAGLMAASIICGLLTGLAGERTKPHPSPSEQTVASAMDLTGFGDVIEGSLTRDATSDGGEVQTGGGD